MFKILTEANRSALIHLSSSLPRGSKERRTILAGLAKTGMEFDSPEALKKYLKDHPKADPKNHWVAGERREKPERSEDSSAASADLRNR